MITADNGARRTGEFCKASYEALEACKVSSATCLKRYHVDATATLANAKASSDYLFGVASWLEDLDQMYLEGRSIARKIHDGAASAASVDSDIAAFKETCQILIGASQL